MKRMRILAPVAALLLAGGGWVTWFLASPGVTDAARSAALASLGAHLGVLPTEGTLIVVDLTRLYARDLSDEPESFKSSGGLFLVADRFEGVQGTSLLLEDLERAGTATPRTAGSSSTRRTTPRSAPCS
jgi:hypothetical protein